MASGCAAKAKRARLTWTSERSVDGRRSPRRRARIHREGSRARCSFRRASTAWVRGCQHAVVGPGRARRASGKGSVGSTEVNQRLVQVVAVPRRSTGQACLGTSELLPREPEGVQYVTASGCSCHCAYHGRVVLISRPPPAPPRPHRPHRRHCRGRRCPRHDPRLLRDGRAPPRPARPQRPGHLPPRQRRPCAGPGSARTRSVGRCSRPPAAAFTCWAGGATSADGAANCARSCRVCSPQPSPCLHGPAPTVHRGGSSRAGYSQPGRYRSIGCG